MKNNKSKIWCYNFSVSRASFLLAHEVTEVCYNFQDLIIGQKAIHEIIWVQAGNDNTATYFIKKELRKLIDLTLEAIVNKPDHVKKVQKLTESSTDKLINLAKEIRKKKLEKLTNKQLGFLYQKLYRYVNLNHGTALSSTWFVDSDGEDLTNYLLSDVKKRIENSGKKINFAYAFSLLTTPVRYNFGQLESLESLRVLQKIKNNNQAKKIFLQKDVNKIENDLIKITPKLNQIISRHFYQWRWMPYTYLGPAYDLKYYLEIWSTLLKQNVNITKEISVLKSVNQKTAQQKKAYFKLLKINNHDKKVYDLAADIVWLKAFRKDGLFYASWAADLISKEVGKRFGFSLNQVRFFTHYEIADLLVKNKMPKIELINQRMKDFVIHSKNGKFEILTGKKAKSFLAKQSFEKVSIKDVAELTGTPACSGRVEGVVKIVNFPEEMEKMNKGNIMVAHTTFPSLVPAMKKAAAIITDDGGLTCHAAIVARELKIPCVVGTKIATKVLKDGDLVIVDADNGIIKRA